MFSDSEEEDHEDVHTMTQEDLKMEVIDLRRQIKDDERSARAYRERMASRISELEDHIRMLCEFIEAGDNNKATPGTEIPNHECDRKRAEPSAPPVLARQDFQPENIFLLRPK